MEVSKDAERVPLNPRWRWVGEQQEYLRFYAQEIHPAVRDMAVRMLHGAAELHATDRPVLAPDGESGLILSWYGDKESPLYGLEIEITAPLAAPERYEQYNPWSPVHPPGVWNRNGANDEADTGA